MIVEEVPSTSLPVILEDASRVFDTKKYLLYFAPRERHTELHPRLHILTTALMDPRAMNLDWLLRQGFHSPDIRRWLEKSVPWLLSTRGLKGVEVPPNVMLKGTGQDRYVPVLLCFGPDLYAPAIVVYTSTLERMVYEPSGYEEALEALKTWYPKQISVRLKEKARAAWSKALVEFENAIQGAREAPTLPEGLGMDVRKLVWEIMDIL